MAESGIGFAEIFETIKELTVENYSYTETDYNTNFLGEEFWFFGISKKFEDEVEDFYIKLKIRMLSEDEFLLIMSFHPEQPVTEEERLKFPYRTDKKL